MKGLQLAVKVLASGERLSLDLLAQGLAASGVSPEPPPPDSEK